MSSRVEIDYTNWRGERSKRIVQPIAIVFGNTEWHKEDQWLLEALIFKDSKPHIRKFAVKDIHSWVPLKE